jgi:hypothetical protein
MPMMEEVAPAAMEGCPDAFVINYTNPMTLCTAVLYAAAPSIMAHGRRHEVFAVQERVAAIIAGLGSLPRTRPRGSSPRSRKGWSRRGSSSTCPTLANGHRSRGLPSWRPTTSSRRAG